MEDNKVILKKILRKMVVRSTRQTTIHRQDSQEGNTTRATIENDKLFLKGFGNTCLSRLLKTFNTTLSSATKMFASREGGCHHATPRSFKQSAAHHYTLTIRTQIVFTPPRS